MQLAGVGVLDEGDVVRLVGARQEDAHLGLTGLDRAQDALDQAEAQHLGEDGLVGRHVRPVEQAVVEAHRGHAVLGVGTPGRRVLQAQAIAHMRFLGIELELVARGQGEAQALAGLQHLAGGDAACLDATRVQTALELVQRSLVQHAVADEVHAGAVGLAQHDAVVVALVPGLEVDTALRVFARFHQADDVAVELAADLHVEDAQLRMSCPHDAGDGHVCLLWVPGLWLPVDGCVHLGALL